MRHPSIGPRLERPRGSALELNLGWALALAVEYKVEESEWVLV